MLTDNGVIVVFSAGNNGSGSDSLNPYSVAPWVISTGATDDQSKLASFSSRGDFGNPLFRPTLVAPGVNTISLRASTLATVTTIDGLTGNDTALSATETPYYTTGSGTSFSAPQVAGVIALMLEANPQLTPGQVRDTLQRTATPLPPYYLYEVGAGMLNAQAAVLEAAFPQRHFGGWRGTAYQNQVQFTGGTPQVFSGTMTPGSSSDSALAIPSDALLASVQLAWGDTLSPNNLNLTLVDPQNVSLPTVSAQNQPGLTGRRQRMVVSAPGGGTWTARVGSLIVPVNTSTTSVQSTSMSSSSFCVQAYTGILEVTSARYAPLADVASLDSSSQSEIYQNFRSLTMWPVGQNFRPSSAVTRASLAMALVLGGRVPQYLPAQSSYADVRDRATMLFVESAQASPNGALFPGTTAGGNFNPDGAVDRLTAVVALVRAAGLRQQAESGSYGLTYTDAASIPSSLRGYVAVAVQNGLIRTSGMTFNPQAALTRLDLAHAMARLSTLATQ
jgi:serine protease AprX